MSVVPAKLHRIFGGAYAVGDDVGVAVKASLWVSVRGLVTGEVPDDQALVARTGKEHVRAASCEQGEISALVVLCTSQAMWPGK